jgi:large subunit ribosomal protein L32
MGVPKRRKSKMRMRQRRAANAYRAPQLSVCAQCGARVRPHRVCPSCGYYKGRQVLSITAA